MWKHVYVTHTTNVEVREQLSIMWNQTRVQVIRPGSNTFNLWLISLVHRRVIKILQFILEKDLKYMIKRLLLWIINN